VHAAFNNSFEKAALCIHGLETASPQRRQRDFLLCHRGTSSNRLCTSHSTSAAQCQSPNARDMKPHEVVKHLSECMLVVSESLKRGRCTVLTSSIGALTTCRKLPVLLQNRLTQHTCVAHC
jgi:hypothetical protein